MKTCAYCGRENEEGAVRCRECGSNSFEENTSDKREGSESKTQPGLPEAEASLVTVRRCRTLSEADVLVTRLEAEGIAAFVPDENLLQATAWNPNTYGYVRVQVRPQDLPSAQVVVASIGGPAEEAEPTEPTGVSQLGLSWPVRIFAFCLPLLLIMGLVMYGLLRARYSSRGYAKKAAQLGCWFASGCVLWLLAFIAGLIAMNAISGR